LCEKGRYYIGKTERPLRNRVEEHFDKYGGSEWTRQYKPIKVVEVIRDADAFDEDKYTKIYMKKHGTLV
jgi:predicted GIY-YIG superfamily endonuclease